jgi:3'-phosphoadenosine 5'-phosphosulfate sulfotransferase (PAPS reductase)/FAD synthetase
MDYDKYIVAFSGGKDSTACFLHLLDLGIPKEKIELWHHDVDGEGSLFDWPITKAYCRSFAELFNVPIYFSWKEGGFEREMNRENTATAPIWFETPYGLDKAGGNGPLNTRLKFPQVSADLKVRWCSAYLKIDVCATAIRNQERFNDIKTVVISGERGEESAARAKYKIHEPDRSDNRGGKRIDRHVDRWRPIKDWKESQVWEIIEKYKVVAHPCYYLGFSRCSCLHCIFGNKNQFASSKKIDPKGFEKLINYEEKFGITIKRNESLKELSSKGTAYSKITELSKLREIAKTDFYLYPESLITENWTLPSGAFGDSCGPN